MKDTTKAWELYEAGRNYNHRLVPDQYSLVETNTEFFIGNQWLHLPQTPAMRSLPKPTFNILKRVASLFIASLTSSAVTIRYEPLAYYDGGGSADPHAEAVRMANAAVKNLLEQFRFDYRVRQALFDGAQTGDYCAHFYMDLTGLRKTTRLDFSAFDQGTFTETLDGGETVTYTVEFGEVDGESLPVKLTDPAGHVTAIQWKEGG